MVHKEIRWEKSKKYNSIGFFNHFICTLVKSNTTKKVKLLSLESTERGIITVTFKNVLEAAGYQIAYSTASDFTSSKVKKIFSNKANKARLKPGEIYYVKIRAYKTDSAGKRVYGTYSKRKKLRLWNDK